MSTKPPSMFRSGEYFIWICGAAISLALTLVLGLLFLILINGLRSFWPSDIVQISTTDEKKILGQIQYREMIPADLGASGDGPRYRVQVKQGNRDLYGQDFVWVDEAHINGEERPKDVVAIERREWGMFFGFLSEIGRTEIGRSESIVASGRAEAWKAFPAEFARSQELTRAAQKILLNDIGEINHQQESIRLEERRLEGEAVSAEAKAKLLLRKQELSEQYKKLENQVSELRAQDTAYLKVVSVDGQEKRIPLSDVIHVYQPNSKNVFQKFWLYCSRILSFITEDPRESNTEGGVFPAIFGTVMLVLIMSVCVTPFGVLAGIYLREYAKQGKFVSAVRIAVNNLAGVPSIVFGVFGVGFFIYFLGGSIDQLFYAEALPTPTYGTGGILWASLTLALLTVPTVIVATEEGLASLPKHLREASYALGATKFETVCKVVIPAIAPAILTGVILAVARAAGEVAPLMITGVVKLAPTLPVDGSWPFVHLDRKFMHLGFHIFDVGFQSPNVEAARPMVYSSTLLLLVIVVLLNLGALLLRNRIRRRYRVSAV